jgi:hypothetical protein
MPTLERLPKTIPVIAQPEAAARIAPLGFKDVTAIKPGQELPIAGGRLRVRATAGALVGPPWSARQNGFVLREAAGEGVARPASLYYEPHCGGWRWGLHECVSVVVDVRPWLRRGGLCWGMGSLQRPPTVAAESEGAVLPTLLLLKGRPPSPLPMRPH